MKHRIKLVNLKSSQLVEYTINDVSIQTKWQVWPFYKMAGIAIKLLSLRSSKLLESTIDDFSRQTKMSCMHV